MTRFGERGVALLEALVALAVLSAVGLGLLGLVTEGLRTERVAGQRERLLATEDRVLSAVTLLRRDQLDRRVGRHPLGEFVIDVARPERALYRIALAQAASPNVEDLVTVVYRPEASRGP